MQVSLVARHLANAREIDHIHRLEYSIQGEDRHDRPKTRRIDVNGLSGIVLLGFAIIGLNVLNQADINGHDAVVSDR